VARQYIGRGLLRQLSGDGVRIVAVLTEALFEAYLDEGGTHAGSPILAVAGYFGLHEQWTEFLSHWPHTEFHASKDRYDCLKSSLADAIDVSLLCGTEACIRPDIFKVAAGPNIKAHLGNAYALAAFLCAAMICKKAQLVVSNARISFVLEDGQPNVEWVRRMLIMMMQEYPIASVTVAKKTDFPQLHPADFLAHSRATSNKQWMDRLFAKKFVNEIPINGNVISETAAKTVILMKHYRNQKAKERKERKRRHSDGKS
jgi:hypothetical protein